MKQLEKPMSFSEVKAFLGRGNTWLYAELQSGRLPGHKLGGQWVVYPSELQTYLERLPGNRKKLRLAK